MSNTDEQQADEEDGIVNEHGQHVDPIDKFFREYRRGVVLPDLSKEFHALIDDVVRIDKKGTMTIELEVEPAGDMQVNITVKSKSKPPIADQPSAHYFVNRDGNPTRDDPYQGTLVDDNGKGKTF